jgi:hypothetical protein
VPPLIFIAADRNLSAPITPADKKDALNRILARPLFGFRRQKIGIAPFFQIGVSRQISNSLIFNMPDFPFRFVLV